MKKIIYIRLLNEGTNVLRPVLSYNIDNNLYEVGSVDMYDPEDEVWEFPPGTHVSVEEQNYDGEIILVAINKYTPSRTLTIKEEKLIALLIKKSSVHFPKNWNKNLLAYQMNDGGMGSLRLFYQNESRNERRFGNQVSELEFTDSDGVKVCVSLNVDEEGLLYELDIWKTDFSKLIEIPDLE